MLLPICACLCTNIDVCAFITDERQKRLRISLGSSFLACAVCQWRRLTHSDMYVCVSLTMANAFPSNGLTMWVRWSVYA